MNQYNILIVVIFFLCANMTYAQQKSPLKDGISLHGNVFKTGDTITNEKSKSLRIKLSNDQPSITHRELTSSKNISKNAVIKLSKRNLSKEGNSN